MAKHEDNGSNRKSRETLLFGLYNELNDLEDVLEDMIALKVSSVADIERRMHELNEELDDLEQKSS